MAEPGVPAKRRRRPIRWLAAATVLLVLLAGGALLVSRPAPVRSLLGGAEPTPSTPASPPPPSPVLDAAADAPVPTRDGIAAALGGLADDQRVGRLSASVVDLATGERLYEREATSPSVPASVTKLVTGAAVLAARGPNHRIPTRAYAGSRPGEVVLVGGGDPTLAVDGGDTYRGAARLDRLAKQVKQALEDTSPTRVLVDSSVFTGATLGPGWDSDIASYGYAGHITGLMVNGGRVYPDQRAPRSTRPALAAGRAFAKLLGVPAESVATGQPPQDAKQLGEVLSPPVIRLVEMTLRDSDNVVAEALARQVALARQQEASFEGAAAAITELLGELGLPADQLTLADGSGLSRRNRLTTEALTTLLTRAADDSHAELSGLFTGLAVAGYSGTLHDRFDVEKSSVGVVRAKTGTLNGVSALSGVVVDADGRLLAFSLIANQVPGGSDAAETVLDQIADKLAGCGCR